MAKFMSGDYANGKDAATILQPHEHPATLQPGQSGPRFPGLWSHDHGNKTGFINKVRGMSFAFTERFEAHIEFPGKLDLSDIGDEQAQYLRTREDAKVETSLLCEEVQIPGMTLANKELQLGNWTFYRNTNMGFLGNEINITFYSDADWNLRYVFERWMAHCVDPTSKQPAYANDQHGQVLINQLDKQNKIRGQWQLMECTPKVLNLVPLSMGAVSIARTTLIVSSGYWKSRAIDVDLNKLNTSIL